jgi:hypothetical protein
MLKSCFRPFKRALKHNCSMKTNHAQLIEKPIFINLKKSVQAILKGIGNGPENHLNAHNSIIPRREPEETFRDLGFCHVQLHIECKWRCGTVQRNLLKISGHKKPEVDYKTGSIPSLTNAKKRFTDSTRWFCNKPQLNCNESWRGTPIARL